LGEGDGAQVSELGIACQVGAVEGRGRSDQREFGLVGESFQPPDDLPGSGSPSGQMSATENSAAAVVRGTALTTN
jgi:hypothetical protein